ncbi:efflux RND transporter periplasmic adaptor subunit, partial [candidate division KSB1 bacterium]|nr:efflux RND transporter periplasmic adaptor subunit [candidate division KSB1 bacterium]NIR69849.1 efflux RND transporter periplasmic adaptor subunit [candidate division KSB1 bacterium]NIS22969.1 efflux RND transporter periplasmic adaptor subunit [candidate division KSB1 bacterium]NIT69826.1 efflux RND transporter periplasmic adaptor subunit [candidate division KSB1 bacterium]NIU23500.1 efflux RND transporter periplasmic adaptor subunit [candidate division KSB1 bacterium]
SNGIAEKVTDVKVMTVNPQTFVDFIEVTGTVSADIATTVSAEESGAIETFVKDKGDWVQKDGLVIRLKSKVLEAKFEEAKASYLLSKATFERQANLYKDNVISEQKYLEHKYSYEMNKARYENLKARFEKTQIKSPISGVIDMKMAEVGEFVQPGTSLFSIVKTDIVKIKAGIPERYIQDVEKGSTAHITFDILPDEQFEGKVTFVGPSINKSSRTFPIEIELGNKHRLLKPEMFANIRIKKVQLDSAVVIQRDALIETEAGKFVFVARGNIALKRDVRIGASYNNQILIKEGLNPNDQLIVVGHRDLVDGERIAIHE